MIKETDLGNSRKLSLISEIDTIIKGGFRVRGKWFIGDMRKTIFTQRVIRTWNALSESGCS